MDCLQRRPTSVCWYICSATASSLLPPSHLSKQHVSSMQGNDKTNQGRFQGLCHLLCILPLLFAEASLHHQCGRQHTVSELSPDA
jgi:hypothetical protein